MTYLDEAQAEIATVEYFRDLGYGYVHWNIHVALSRPGRTSPVKSRCIL